MTNGEMLAGLLAIGEIRLRDDDFLWRAPEPVDAGFEKIAGMMLGLAVGDAMGLPTEGRLPATRREQYGEIRDYVPNRHTGLALGYPSDDTQLAVWTLEELLAAGGLAPERLAARFLRDRHRIVGMGHTVRDCLRSLDAGVPWQRAGQHSAGNGALMRIAPVLIPHVRRPAAALWADAALAAMLTHNDAGSTAACVAFVHMLWQLLGMRAAPEPGWWLATYVEAAHRLETGSAYRTRSGRDADFAGPLWRYVEEKVTWALERDLPVLEACESWQSGAYLLETLPCVIYILTRHGDSYEEAIVRAVNDTKDNDTVAAIVGAALGALHGRAGIPQRWLAGLTGQTTLHDEGKLFAVLEQARERWFGEGDSA